MGTSFNSRNMGLIKNIEQILTKKIIYDKFKLIKQLNSCSNEKQEGETVKLKRLNS